jgi:iron complex transport system permease protein
LEQSFKGAPVEQFRTQLRPRRVILTVAFLAVILSVVTLLSLTQGTISFSVPDVWRALTDPAADESLVAIVRDIRLPRVLLAVLIGAGLSVAGAVFQALLRNVLAEPYILGISSGGALGAVLAAILNVGIASVSVPLFSLIGSGLVMLLVYVLGHRRGFMDPHSLLLSGVMIGAFFNAVILLIVSLFNQETRTAYLWLLGNLSGATYDSVAIVGIAILRCSGILLFFSQSLNLLSAGEETAAFLGANVPVLKRWLYLLASVMTGLVVSVGGVIGFVGLIIPHLCRLTLGADHRLLLPACFLVGGIFLLLCDLVSRVALAPAEIPVGAITAVVGVPLFVYLLKRRG